VPAPADRGFDRKKASGSFLKKRTKKLLLPKHYAFRDLVPNE
jgi:hypothetical protein